jgi:hypothetical protein
VGSVHSRCCWLSCYLSNEEVLKKLIKNYFVLRSKISWENEVNRKIVLFFLQIEFYKKRNF